MYILINNGIKQFNLRKCIKLIDLNLVYYLL